MRQHKSTSESLKFSAKLLFQFRVQSGRVSNKRRLCEERIIVFDSQTATDALKHAKKLGKTAQHRYKNNEGATVHFEFVGVLDLLLLGAECDEGEVWYDHKEILLPKERSAAILPADRDLNAIQWEHKITSSIKRRSINKG